MYFDGPYLRVLTPRTTNGVLPLIINGEVQNKEAFLPLTARKQLEKKNARLLKNGHGHLVATIEVVGEEPVRPNPKPAQTPEIPNPVVPRKPNPKPRKKSE